MADGFLVGRCGCPCHPGGRSTSGLGAALLVSVFEAAKPCSIASFPHVLTGGAPTVPRRFGPARLRSHMKRLVKSLQLLCR